MITFNNSGQSMPLRLHYCEFSDVKIIINDKFGGTSSYLYRKIYPEQVFNYTLVDRFCQSGTDIAALLAAKHDLADTSEHFIPYSYEDGVRYGPALSQNYIVLCELYSPKNFNFDILLKHIKLFTPELLLPMSVFLISFSLLISKDKTINSTITNIIKLLSIGNTNMKSIKFLHKHQQIIFLSWCIALFFIYQNVTAAFSTNLVVEDKNYYVNTLDEIITRHREPLWVEGSYEVKIFEDSEIETYKRIFNYAKQIGLQKCIIERKNFNNWAKFSSKVAILKNWEGMMLMRLFCTINQKVEAYIRVAKEKYSKFLISAVFSNSLHPAKEEFLNTWYSCLFNSGILNYNFLMYSRLFGPADEKCINHQYTYEKTKQMSHSILSINNIYKLFCVYLVVILLIISQWVISIILVKIKKLKSR